MTTKQQQFIKATLEFISLNNAEIQHHMANPTDEGMLRIASLQRHNEMLKERIKTAQEAEQHSNKFSTGDRQ